MKASDMKRSEKINGIKIPELEGRVRIELRDAKTGHIDKDVEGKNIVTNAVRDVFRSNYFGCLDYKDIMPIMDFFFGGILCFENALTEDADNYYIPSYGSNPITAHTGDITPSTAEEWAEDRSRGGELNSGEVTGGYSRVFFFPETQGNGRIASLSFTHKDMGNYYPHGMARTYPLYVNTQGQTQYLFDGQAQTVFVDRANRIAYMLSVSGTTLTIKRVENYGAIDGIGLLQKYPDYANADTTTTRVATHTYTMPLNAQLMRYMFIEDEQKIHCIATSGTTLTRRVIDLTDMTMTSLDATVDGAAMVAFVNNGTHALPINLDVDGYMYIAGTGRIYRFKYGTVITDVSSVEYTGGFAPYDNTIRGYGHMGIGHLSRVLTNGKTYAVRLGTSDYFTDWSWNTLNFMRPVFVDNQLVSYSNAIVTGTNSNCLPTQAVFNKMFLSTVKNLEEPVTKQATQTMTITYTITEVEPQEEND